MKKNLKPRVKVIEGEEYMLPPGVCFVNTKKKPHFQVRTWYHDLATAKYFHFASYKSIAEALKAASQYAEAAQKKREEQPPYAVHGYDKHGNPQSFGKGIYLQTNADRGNYQLFNVIYGSKGKGNFRRGVVSLGRAGFFTKYRFALRLKRAQEMRLAWEQEDKRKNAANNPAFTEKKQA